MNLNFSVQLRMSNSFHEDSIERKEKDSFAFNLMQMNVTRIGSIIKCANVRGYSTQILDNVSARDYAHRSFSNELSGYHERYYYGYLKNVGLIIKRDKIIDRRFGPFSRRMMYKRDMFVDTLIYTSIRHQRVNATNKFIAPN